MKFIKFTHSVLAKVASEYVTSSEQELYSESHNTRNTVTVTTGKIVQQLKKTQNEVLYFTFCDAISTF